MKINKARAKATVFWLCIILTTFWVGFTAGFSDATGGLPFVASYSESAVPPSDIAKVSLSEAEQTLESLHNKTYGEGYNCLDYAWEAMRLLQWKGQLAMIVRLDLEPDPNHTVIIVPTTDEGWVFIEPQTGERIYPTVGGNYRGFTTIKGVDILRVEWTAVDVYVTDSIAGASGYYGEGGE